MVSKHDKISDYGHSFQLKVIVSLLLNSAFIKRVINMLESDYFDSETTKTLIKLIQKHFIGFKKAPTLEALLVYIGKHPDPVFQESLKKTIESCRQYLTATDLDFVQQETIDFCKNKVLRNAIIDSVDLLKIGDYDAIKKKIDIAYKSGSDVDYGLNVRTDIDERYTDNNRHVVPTGWGIIDDLLDGGLGRGDLGIIVASVGGGKSWLLTALSIYAILHEKTIVYYTMELMEEYTGQRFDSVITGIPFRELKFNIDVVKKQWQQVKVNPIIKFYATRRATVNTLASHIDSLKAENIIPDLIVVDYADKLKPTIQGTRDKTHELLGDIYDELKGLAGELQIPIWSASQTNREGSSEDIIQGRSVSASYEKLMIADFVFSMSRKLEDKISNSARIHIIKNRYGPDGLTYPASFNGDIGKLEIYEPTSDLGIEQKKKTTMDGEIVKKYLSSRHDTFQSMKK